MLLDWFYRSLSSFDQTQLYAKINIRVALIGVQTWTQQDLITVVSDPHTLLDNFHDHLKLATEQFDSAILITLVILSVSYL